ncbi:MAG: hypothetical protein CMJ18_12750 [Phycisphaeraceae bacterium]|nr:hypothetical protein [Phycisphaeraceae bacterium]
MLPMHECYRRLVEKASTSHEQGRRSDLLDASDIGAARLYCYALRAHTIGTFHATRQAVLTARDRLRDDAPDAAQLERAAEQLQDLANLGMEDVPTDFRVVVSTFHRYHTHMTRVIDALERAGGADVAEIAGRFRQACGRISGSNGICPTQDLEPQPQASFIVPNLGITIVPLVYGDHHSWNMAYLSAEHLDVPFHMHHSGVEIHLGYAPLEGYMVLGDCKAAVDEGYALPIPPGLRHGWTNTSGAVHHVPFIFGSLKQAGWGVFLDVEPRPIDVADLETVPRSDWRTGPSVMLEREIDALARQGSSRRQVLVPASNMDRDGSGGLELAATRIGRGDWRYGHDDFRILSIVRGSAAIDLDGVTSRLTSHDHVGVPSSMTAQLSQEGDEPLVVLDALIRGKGIFGY